MTLVNRARKEVESGDGRKVVTGEDVERRRTGRQMC